MTQGVIWKQLLEFSIPMMIGLIFQQFYNTVDTIVVGQFVGKEALAAVGSTGSICNMLVGLCAGIATGAGVVISQNYGAHDYEKLHDSVHTVIVLTFLMSIAATIIGILIVDPMLRFMSTPDDVFGEAHTYLTIYFAGVTGLLFYNMGSGILRAVGDSRRPLYFLIFSACCNIVLDLLFVVAFHLGVAGVAYATIISQCLSALLTLFSLSHTDAPYGIRWTHLKLDFAMLKRILAIGLPSGIQQAVTSFSNVFVQSYINFFGSACMAGWSSYNKLDAFVLIPMQSIALANTTFVGQNYGADNLPRARKGNRQALIMSIAVSAALSVVAMVLARPLISLFTSEPDVQEFGVRFVLTITPFYSLCCFNQIYSGALRGIGNATVPTIIMLSSFVVFRQIYLFVNKTFFANNFTGLSLAYPMGWVVCSILIVIYYHTSVLCHPEKREKLKKQNAEG